MTTLNDLARMTMSKAKAPAGTAALFIDLAGVLLDATPSPGQPAGLRAGVGPALRLLDRLDYRMVVLAPCALDRRRALRLQPERIADLLAREGVFLADFCCCTCTGEPCRDCPPSAFLLQQAAREHGLVLSRSWLLARSGDQLAAGQRAGCRTLLIGRDGDENHTSAWPPVASLDAEGPAVYMARDIVDAALAIIRIDGAA
jgi:histidinol phosphatase-like enzyme